MRQQQIRKPSPFPIPLYGLLKHLDLYKVVTEIKSGNKTIDRVETSFGIRSIRFDAANGFLLNDKRVILKGGCIHHDNGPLGAAAIRQCRRT